MRRQLKFLVTAAFVLSLGFAGSAAADDWTAKWSNGHKIESADDEFELKFGGRVQADFTFADVDSELGTIEDGFEFRRARLFFSGTIYERIEFKAQYDFAGGDADFKDVWIAIDNEWGDVQIGHFKEHFSLEELTSSKYITFLERSLPVEAFAPSRNSGVALHGSTDAVSWGVGAYYDADDFGESVSEDDTNLTGRVVYRPIHDEDGEAVLHVGFAGSVQDRGTEDRYRARPENHLAGRFVDTSSFASDGATLLGAEIAGAFGPLWFAGEYMQTDVDTPMGADPTFDGYYAAVGYFLTGEHRAYKSSSGAWDRTRPKVNFGKGAGGWEIAARFSSVDLSDESTFGGEEDNYTLALNWYLNPATRMMLNWVHADVDGAGEADFVGLRWQVDF